jgi:hypothetical protein
MKMNRVGEKRERRKKMTILISAETIRMKMRYRDSIIGT